MCLRLVGSLLALALLISVPAWAAEPSTVDQTAYMRGNLIGRPYPEIRDVSLQILERFPPDQYFYIGIGRSPTPVMAFFEGLGIQGVSTLPLSGMKKFDKFTGPSKEALQKRITEHLIQWLPTKKELAGRKVLLIDYASSADGIIAATREISTYEASQRPRTEVLTVGLFSMERTKKKLIENKIFPIEMQRSLSGAMTYMQYERWAKVGAWYPWDPKSTSFKPRPEYKVLTAALTEEMKKDPELKTRLSPEQLLSFEKQALLECVSAQVQETLRP